MSEKQKPFITTIEGSADLSTVQPGDQVQYRTERSNIIFPANALLTADRQPIMDLPDGGHVLLDGAHITKLGGDFIGLVEHPEK